MKTKEDAKCSAASKLQKQEWKFQDSMKITAFLLIPGLLLYVAFGNSVTWYLQTFWKASSFFWQTQWENLHHRLGGNEWAIFTFGTAIVPLFIFWGLNGIFLVADTTQKPSFITQYSIRLGKKDLIDRAKLFNVIRTVLFNQFFITLPMLMLMLPILKRRGDPCSLSLPTFHWFLLELAVYVILQEISFYYIHRLIHHPLLFKHIHKKHHEWTAPVSIVSIYAHPVDHIISNMVPLQIGPVLLGSHVTSIMAWLSLAVLNSTVVHSGYHLPFLPPPEFHDYHHLTFNHCYGNLGIMDHLHGTDTSFKQTKVYMNISKSLPELPKKSE
uniref:Uncharacterized protein n=3 Tax=Sphaerodactylus townsendi TaxID=933632 RepID=A0ACB8EIP0_9SAUR